MTSYAPNYTARLRVKYRAALGVHTQTWRFPVYGTLGAGMIAAKEAVEAIWSHIAVITADDAQCLAVTYAVENSDIFLPTSTIDIHGDVTLPTDDPSIKAYALSMVGRTELGQPAKVFFYGPLASQVDIVNSQNFRLNPGENVDVDAAIAEANGFIAGLILCGSDGTAVTWYPYMNQKDNDYWVKRLRVGA